jgi:hypothetical protein
LAWTGRFVFLNFRYTVILDFHTFPLHTFGGGVFFRLVVVFWLEHRLGQVNKDWDIRYFGWLVRKGTFFCLMHCMAAFYSEGHWHLVGTLQLFVEAFFLAW